MAAQATEAVHTCEICGVEGLSDTKLRKHVGEHVSDLIVCPFCDLSNVSSDEMLVHVNTSHLDFLTPQNEYFSFIDDDEAEKKPTVITPESPLNQWLPSNNNNYCEIAAGSSNERSPLRSQLNLNLRSRENYPGNLLYHCPMCVHTTESPDQLEEHINRVHFDPVSPSLKSATTAKYNCPFCTRSFSDSPDLELHVNNEHRDILSPGKRDGAVSTDDWSRLCPICCRSNFPTNKAMTAHIESHFDGSTPSPATPDFSSDRLLAREMELREKEARRAREEWEFERLRAQYGMDNQGNFKEQSIANMQRAVFEGEMSISDFFERKIGLNESETSGVDDGTSCTKGLIPKIRAASVSTPGVVRTLLCTTADHYASTYGDRGWGCGYRNIQMLISSLLYHTGYNEHLYKPGVPGCGLFGFNGRSSRNSVPSISRLQKHIEWAWRQGFDSQGAEQFDSKLHNTRKWIGATEAVIALSSLRIRCELVDFHQPTTADGSHPELFKWVLRYFERHQEFTPPLYLQHQGHSRTIVGIEVNRDGQLTLLVFDPSHTRKQLAQLKCTPINVPAMRYVRKNLSSLRARQYQLVAVDGIMETEYEYEGSKRIRSLRVPIDR